MGGGPSSEQKRAAARQEQLAQQEGALAAERNIRERGIYDKIMPFATDRMTNGLPFFNALSDYNSTENTQSWAPAKAEILRRTSSTSDLPDGYRESLLNDLEANRARSFDASLANLLMMNDQAKMQGAGLLTGQQQMADPAAFYGLAGNTNQSIFNSQNLRKSSPWGAIAGGAAQGAMSMF